MQRNRYPVILRPVIVGSGSNVAPQYLYYYNSEITYTSNTAAHKAGTEKTWYYQYDYINYQYTIENSLGSKEWKLGKNIGISNLDSIMQCNDYNYRIDYPSGGVTSTFTHENSVTVNAIDKNAAKIGTIYTLSGNQNATHTFFFNRGVTPTIFIYTTNGGINYTGSDTTYNGPLNGLLIECTFNQQISSTNSYSSPIIQGSRMQLGCNPFLV